MSSPVVSTVAWLALLGVAGLGFLLVVLLRRLDVLDRAHTDRKWEIVALRAEVGALRRGLGTGDPDDVAARVPEQDGGDRDADASRAARAWPASPTAWRRGRTGPPTRPRRRRPG